MLGIQYPRSLPDPTLPSTSSTFGRPTPPSRERLGLRSLAQQYRSPSVQSGSPHPFQRKEGEAVRAMSGDYGSASQSTGQSLSQYSNGTYGSAMAGISGQRSVPNQTANWQTLPPANGYQSSQASLSTSRGQSRAASPEFETQPSSYGSHSYGPSKAGSNNTIHPYLQLPPTISPSGGSISEFAAQVRIWNHLC